MSNIDTLSEEEIALEEEHRFDQATLRGLLFAVGNSKNAYEADVSTFVSSVCQIDDSSPILRSAKEYYFRKLSDTSDSSNYDSLRCDIANLLD